MKFLHNGFIALFAQAILTSSALAQSVSSDWSDGLTNQYGV